MLKEGARPYADLPGGHSEGYDDTFKQVFRRFYDSIARPEATPEYPQFADGLRQLKILDAELASHHRHGWTEVLGMNLSALSQAVNRHSGYQKGRLFFVSSLALTMAGINASLRANSAADLQRIFLDPIDQSSFRAR